ncbi:MAG: hypothetical protein R3B47_03110 [Bacteroidia bacterium]
MATIAPVADVCFDGGANSVSFQYTGPSNVSTIQWFFAQRPVVHGTRSRYASYFVLPLRVPKPSRWFVARAGCLSDTARVTFQALRDPIADSRLIRLRERFVPGM